MTYFGIVIIFQKCPAWVKKYNEKSLFKGRCMPYLLKEKEKSNKFLIYIVNPMVFALKLHFVFKN
jgi:hypothetical protein